MKAFKILIITFFLPTILLGQIIKEKKFYDSKLQECDSNLATSTVIFYYNSSSSKSGYSKTYNSFGTVTVFREFSDLDDKIQEGKSILYYDNGQTKSICEIKNGKLQGDLVTYYLSGTIRRKDFYSNDELIKGNCYTESGLDTTYFEYEIMPQFPGGEREMYNFISRNIVYPKKAIRKGIKGRVFTKFIIDDNGYVKDAEISRSLHPLLDKAALDVINKMPKWQPGIQDGDPVNVTFYVPIKFTIN